jgi:WD40 repeat protein
VWDVATGRLRYPGIHHGFRCHDIAFSPDGRLLATAGYDGFARTWDLATGQSAGPDLHHPAWVFSVRFSSDGNQLLTGCSDRMARLWDWRAGRLTHAPLKHEGQVFLGEFMPDDRSILTASDDSRWCLWERQTGRPLTPRILYEDIGIHRSVCIVPDGKRLVFSGLPLSLVDLSSLPSDLLTPRESRRRAELHAGRTIESGGEVNLTTKEWVDRWQKWEELPDLPIVELSTSESL